MVRLGRCRSLAPACAHAGWRFGGQAPHFDFAPGFQIRHRSGHPHACIERSAAEPRGVEMGAGRLELPRVAPYAPQTYVSANSTTRPDRGTGRGEDICRLRLSGAQGFSWVRLRPPQGCFGPAGPRDGSAFADDAVTEPAPRATARRVRLRRRCDVGTGCTGYGATGWFVGPADEPTRTVPRPLGSVNSPGPSAARPEMTRFRGTIRNDGVMVGRKRCTGREEWIREFSRSAVGTMRYFSAHSPRTGCRARGPGRRAAAPRGCRGVRS